jgi:hypothetical protein
MDEEELQITCDRCEKSIEDCTGCEVALELNRLCEESEGLGYE